MDERKKVLKLYRSASVSAPAGSGKTQLLAERYVEILRNGVSPRRILCITFTDKAAGEMKMRILKILREKHPELYKRFEDELLMMRVSTIHSFCYSLLRRFALESGFPISLSVLQGQEMNSFVEDSFQQFLDRNVLQSRESLFITLSAYLGWNKVENAINTFFYKRPLSNRVLSLWLGKDGEFPDELKSPEIERYLESLKKLDVKGAFNSYRQLEKILKKKELKFFDERHNAFITSLLFHIFQRFLEIYDERKRREGKVDFADMELLSDDLLKKNPNWSNILEIFDQHTSHILIDEFQDTNFLEWGVVKKLVEEWRSGKGVKEEKGEPTSLFIVGDPKQSIYLFRQANVSVFKRARKEMKRWWKKKYVEKDLQDNYRSLTSIIEFNNYIFKQLMKGGKEPWEVEYIPFKKQRNNQSPGFVEIILPTKSPSRILERKEMEAEWIAKKILLIVGKKVIYERDESQRKAEFRDIAVLLRKRTHLNTFEKAFQRYNIPYVVLGGLGFWSEPEISLLTHIVEFLVEPTYTYGLYLFLKSPLGETSDELITRWAFRQEEEKGEPFINKIEDKETLNNIRELCDRVRKEGLRQTLSTLLLQKEFYKLLNQEGQRYRNVKKFLKIISQMEEEGLTPYEIANVIRSNRNRSEEPRASVFSENMNVVRILTIHKAKGLEFPVVIVLGIEEIESSLKDTLIFDETEDGSSCFYASKNKKKYYAHQVFYKKLQEENKRLFYVALTRARDGLIISGHPIGKQNGFTYLQNALNLKLEDGNWQMESLLKDISIIKPSQIDKEFSKIAVIKREKPLLSKECISIPEFRYYGFHSVTEEEERKPGKKLGRWHIFGDVMHRILEKVSLGRMQEGEELQLGALLFRQKGSSKKEIERFIEELKRQIALLKDKGIWESVILPQDNSRTESSFFTFTKYRQYKGRLDRIIFKENKVLLYDYKTMQIKKEEIPYEVESYRSQINIYRSFLQKTFPNKNIHSYLIFTSLGEVVEIN